MEWVISSLDSIQRTFKYLECPLNGPQAAYALRLNQKKAKIFGDRGIKSVRKGVSVWPIEV